MGWLSGGVFWGAVFLLLGITVILGAVFKVQIPVFRIFFALLFIFIGLRILAWGPCCGVKNPAVFNDQKFEAGTGVQKQYDIIFGRGYVDLSGVSLKDGSVKTKISTVFGSSVIKLNPDIPAKIVLNSAFSSARMPDGNVTSFGEYTYRTPSFKEGENCLIIQADAVFSSIEIVAADVKL